MSDHQSAKPLAVITGASGGIGEALAEELGAAGYDLLLIARSRALLRNLAERLSEAHNITVDVMDVDLAQPGAADQIRRRLTEDDHAPDILLNNAGFGAVGLTEEISRDQTLGMIDLNVRALTDLTHTLLPMMKEKAPAADAPTTAQWRGVINVASTASFQPGPLMAVYYATKAYVLSFTEALNFELKGTGLRAAAICPGPTLTGFQDRAEFAGQLLVGLMPTMTATQVARRGWQKISKKKRTVAVTGFVNWVVARSAAFVPRRLLLPVIAFMQKARH